ncbi:MAG TPA: UDP-3-O-(3-hydroxymyristoyl)glucosamine N-acyltransferase [Acidobacteriota bacterium]|nr:UDP-3-O-(3-hydroxymyristoyl)glucosamine N-acyltransferase [Acidobacteriota bacterium]
MTYTISEMAALLGLPFQGEGSRQLVRVSKWDAADVGSLVFLESRERQVQIPETLQCACILAPRELVPPGINAIFSERPKLDFARAGALLSPRPCGKGLRDPTSVISQTARIEEGVDIGPHVTVGEGARIGRGSILQAGVVVGDGCIIGQQCFLYPRVVLYPGAELRNRVILHSGVIVGGDGFGYVFDGKTQVKFPQIGLVLVEDDVEIGCNTTLDRGSLGTTRIGAGTKIDNLVQIAHNVQIGQGVVIAAQTGISGSTVIEDYAVIGGQVGFGDHARVQKGAVIGSKAGVLPGKIVRSGDVYWGVPVRPLREYKRLNALFGRLPEMKEDIDTLKEQIAQLQAELRKLEPR